MSLGNLLSKLPGAKQSTEVSTIEHADHILDGIAKNPSVLSGLSQYGKIAVPLSDEKLAALQEVLQNAQHSTVGSSEIGPDEESAFYTDGYRLSIRKYEGKSALRIELSEKIAVPIAPIALEAFSDEERAEREYANALSQTLHTFVKKLQQARVSATQSTTNEHFQSIMK